MIMKRNVPLIIVFLFFSFQNIAFAQTNKTVEIKRIKAYCKTVDAFVKPRKNPHFVFADISDYNDDSKGKWRKFSSDKSLEKFRERNETYTIAYNWRKNGKLIQSNFTFFSPSGDWAQYVYHYFRPDGTLAKVESDMRTFYDDMIILQTIYFDSKGKQIGSTNIYKDLRSKKTKKPSKEFLRDFEGIKNGKDYFKKVSKLPFARFLG
jgi:hypothetical protein